MQLSFNPVARYIADLRDYGMEYVAKRYYSLYGGEVVNNVDDARGQSRAVVSVGVLGNGKINPNGEFEPTPLARRALPTSIYAGQDHGIYFPPEVGDAVWVSFDHGDPSYPRFHGSWWRNSAPGDNPDSSELPAEFRMKGEPKRRGIKTKFGHGIVFSDDEASPYVAIWSGQQVGPGTEAFRRQQITLSDSTSAPTVKGVDETVQEGIYANTIYGHRIALNDTAKTIEISGLRTDPSGVIANSIKIEDLTSRITIKTNNPVPQTIVLDGLTGSISITSPATVSVNAQGAITLGALGGIAMASGAAPPTPPSPGVAVENGQGAKIINFIGAVTETVASFVQNAASTIFNAGVFAVNSPIIQLGPIPGFGITVSLLPVPFIIIGDVVTAKQLLTADIIEWLKTHTHVGNLGAPTPLSAADVLLLQDPLNPLLPNPLFVSNTKMS